MSGIEQGKVIPTEELIKALIAGGAEPIEIVYALMELGEYYAPPGTTAENYRATDGYLKKGGGHAAHKQCGNYNK